MGYSPWGHEELDTTERLSHTYVRKYLWVYLYTKGYLFVCVRIQGA